MLTLSRGFFAPRISSRLLEALVRLDDRSLPIAELNRRLGAEADRLRLPRPSYQRIRVLLHTLRLIRRQKRPQPSTGQLLLEAWFRLRSPLDVIDHLYGQPVRPLPP